MAELIFLIQFSGKLAEEEMFGDIVFPSLAKAIRFLVDNFGDHEEALPLDVDDDRILVWAYGKQKRLAWHYSGLNFDVSAQDVWPDGKIQGRLPPEHETLIMRVQREKFQREWKQSIVNMGIG